MATIPQESALLDELADFLASCPSPEQILAYHPSEPAQQRARELLEKKREDELTEDEREELDEMMVTEILMRLLKAKIRVRQPKGPHE